MSDPQANAVPSVAFELKDGDIVALLEKTTFRVPKADWLGYVTVGWP